MIIKIECKNISIELLEPISLCKFECRLNSDCNDVININKKFGVYFIVNSKKTRIFDKYNYFIPSKNIKYIGKSSGETIFSRNRKHNISIRGIPN